MPASAGTRVVGVGEQASLPPPGDEEELEIMSQPF